MHGPPGQRPCWSEMFWLRGGAVCEGMNVAESPGRGSSGDAGSTTPASWGWVSKTRPDLLTGPRAWPEDRDCGSREACRPWLLWEGTTPLSPRVALVSFRGFSATWLWTLAARFLRCRVSGRNTVRLPDAGGACWGTPASCGGQDRVSLEHAVTYSRVFSFPVFLCSFDTRSVCISHPFWTRSSWPSCTQR